MKKLLTIFLTLISLISFGQVEYGNKWYLAPTRTLVLNDYGIRPNTPADVSRIKQVLRYADGAGYRVTGYGEFDFNNDTIRLNNLDLWSPNKGSFVLKNGKYMEVKKLIKMENIVIDSWLNNTFSVFFWDTVKNAGGTVIYDGLPAGQFSIKIDNCLIKNCNRLFNTGNIDVPKSSSQLVDSYIRFTDFEKMKYGAGNLLFYYDGLDIHKNIFKDFDTTNFKNLMIIGLDNVFRAADSRGLTITENKSFNCRNAVYSGTYYQFLSYGTGTRAKNNMFYESSGALYLAGWNNAAEYNYFENQTTPNDFAIIIKGGTGEASNPTAYGTVKGNEVYGTFGSAIYADYRGNKLDIIGNKVRLDSSEVLNGDACVRILSHGFRSITLSQNDLKNYQTNTSTSAVNITTDDTINVLTISMNEIESLAGGIKFNSQRIKQANVINNPVIFAQLNHTMRSMSTFIHRNGMYYSRSGIWMLSINSADPLYVKANIFKPWYNEPITGTAIARLFDIATDAATANALYYFSDNDYDLSGATVAFYVENPSRLRFKGERVTNSSALNSYFCWVRSAGSKVDIEADDVTIPFGKTFINASMGAVGDSAKLKINKSDLSGTVIVFTSGTASNVYKDSLIIKSSTIPANSYGTGWVTAQVPGAPGTGNTISNDVSSTINKIVVMKGTDGKTIGGYTPSSPGYAYLDANGNVTTNSGTSGSNSVTTDNTIDGDGSATPLGVNPSIVALKAYVDSLVAAALGSGSADTAVKTLYLNSSDFTGTGNTIGDQMSLANPGRTASISKWDNMAIVTGTSYAVGANDVTIIFNGTANSNFTLPAYATARKRKIRIVNVSSTATITCDKSFFITNVNSTNQIAPGVKYLLHYEPSTDKIWVTSEN